MQVLRTQRLILRHLDVSDAPFILRLLNEPSWLQNIGDKGVRTVADAERYIETGPVEMYGRLGFGLYLVCLKDKQEPIGMCGFLKRETLDDVDSRVRAAAVVLGQRVCQRSGGSGDVPRKERVRSGPHCRYHFPDE